jgi:N-acetylglucosaminyldiphosphoundecaprenol N-acetyl-beta-D-mannosaminyltransferase
VVVEDQEFAESKAASDGYAASRPQTGGYAGGRPADNAPAPAPAADPGAADGFMNIPDGIGVRIAARLRDARIESMSGIDLGESLLSIAARSGLRVFFLGAKRGIAKKAAENMRVRHPTLQICGTQHGYFDKSGEKNAAVLEKIRSASPDILFVCFGFPAQERWITDNLASLPSVKLAMGLGGSLDVWSGNLRRAPLLIQKAGLEWLWRTVLEPKRARIFLDIPRFLFLNIKKAD